MKIVLNEDSKVGRCNELVELNDLFARLLILRGKAKRPQEKGSVANQLLWGEVGVISKVCNSFVKNESRIVRYEANPIHKFGIFKYICLTDNNNELCVKHISTGKIYHLDSSKNKFSGIRLNDKVVLSKNITQLLTKHPWLKTEKGITPNTYLTKEQITSIEDEIKSKNVNIV